MKPNFFFLERLFFLRNRNRNYVMANVINLDPRKRTPSPKQHPVCVAFAYTLLNLARACGGTEQRRKTCRISFLIGTYACACLRSCVSTRVCNYNVFTGISSIYLYRNTWFRCMSPRHITEKFLL